MNVEVHRHVRLRADTQVCPYKRGSDLAFQDTWADIQRHAGELFYRLGGATFTYEVFPDHLKISDVEQPVPKSGLERACAAGRPQTVTQLKQLGLPGPSHIFAILTDPRIRI